MTRKSIKCQNLIKVSLHLLGFYKKKQKKDCATEKNLIFLGVKVKLKKKEIIFDQ